ncbi:hypothetical protein TNCV_4849511 [Trichonephila clavipes]|nr:hypothetical protein TNCV_4849511 [Trichonephila clavipes]
MVKFTDYCEVWFQPESVARVAANVGDYRSATRLGIDSNTFWMCSLGKEGQLAPATRRCSTGCLKYRKCVLEECESGIQYRPYHNTRCRTSVEVHNASVQHPLSTVSPDTNPTIVVLQTNG